MVMDYYNNNGLMVIIDDIALNKCGLILMYLSPKSLS